MMNGRCVYHRDTPDYQSTLRVPRLKFSKTEHGSSSWSYGVVHVNVKYYGVPFAFMVVQDGVFDETTVHRCRWILTCSGENAPSPCLTSAMLQDVVMDEFYRFLHDDIVVGCKAFVLEQYPQAVKGACTNSLPK